MRSIVPAWGPITIPPEDGSYFTKLDEVSQHEPTELFRPELLGQLAPWGSRTANSSRPMGGRRKISSKGRSRLSRWRVQSSYASGASKIKYWAKRHSEKMFICNTDFTQDGQNDIDGRILWHHRAICVSPDRLSPTPAVGTAYLTAFRNKDAKYLFGDKAYRLRVPAKVPVKRFWAVTAYDATSRSLLDSGGNITVSSTCDLEVNDDGTVDVIFSPNKPDGDAKNRIKTDPSKGFVVVFRFYGPTEGYIKKTWTLNDFELLKEKQKPNEVRNR